jgi:multidrug resistance efflux pump
LKAAEDADRIASEELKEWLTSVRSQRVAIAERSVKSARDRLAYEEEELRQLEKMYQADDLTEDTEEIILKRTRDSVDSARFGLDQAVEAHRRTMDYTIPRAEEELKLAVQRAVIALSEARDTSPRQLQQQEINLGKQRIAHDEKSKKLERLRRDRQWLKVTAPRSGFVYYGGSKRGRWTDSGALAASVSVGGSAKPKSVLMTVLEPAPLRLRVSVSEDVLRHVKPGTTCQVKPVSYPDERLAGKIENLSGVPISEGTFDAVISVDLGKLQGRVLPGMKGSVTIQPSSAEPSAPAS